MKGLGALQRHQLPHPPCKNPGSATGGSGIGADTMGHRGARAPTFDFRGHGGAQITDMKRK